MKKDMRKKKGFSIAEMLIALLIVSLVITAAIPTVSKKSATGGDQIWQWSPNSSNSIYFGVGDIQTTIIGSQTPPRRKSCT